MPPRYRIPFVSIQSSHLATGEFRRSLVAQHERGTARLLVGGIMGAAGGILAGGLTGLLIQGVGCTDSGNPDSCSGGTGIVVGSLAGEVVGVPVGMHIANGRDGSLFTGLASSAGVAAIGAGIIVAARSDRVTAAVGMALPAAQLAAALAIERRTAN